MRISDWSSDVCSSDLLSAGLMVVAGVDVPLQIIQLMQKLRMSRKEVKDELKQTEGSPEVKMALRRKQREATRNNVRAGVQQAHVILTNPTHFAVALRYDRATDRARSEEHTSELQSLMRNSYA